MPIKDLLKELAALTPEEKAQLAAVLVPANSEIPNTAEKKVNGPEAPKAKPVFFFRQIGRFQVEEVKKDGRGIVKTAVELPPRVIAVDQASASKMFWKRGKSFEYLGWSDGTVWRRARSEGKKVAEAQAMEYEHMLKNGDRTPPPNNEKTFFAGRSIGDCARGQQISWAAGVNQSKIN